MRVRFLLYQWWCIHHLGEGGFFFFFGKWTLLFLVNNLEYKRMECGHRDPFSVIAPTMPKRYYTISFFLRSACPILHPSSFVCTLRMTTSEYLACLPACLASFILDRERVVFSPLCGVKTKSKKRGKNWAQERMKLHDREATTKSICTK